MGHCFLLHGHSFRSWDVLQGWSYRFPKEAQSTLKDFEYWKMWCCWYAREFQRYKYQSSCTSGYVSLLPFPLPPLYTFWPMGPHWKCQSFRRRNQSSAIESALLYRNRQQGTLKGSFQNPEGLSPLPIPSTITWPTIFKHDP